MKTLNLKVDARIMLTMNISVPDGLTNGTIGTIRRFNMNENGQVNYVLIEFVDRDCGSKLRERSKQYLMNGEDNLTPIQRITFEQSIGMKRMF